MGLRVEENFRMADVVTDRTPYVGRGQFVEILFRLQDRRPCVVEIEEGLQIVEQVRRARCLDAGVGQRDVVALREFEHQLRFKRPLDVQMQLGFGQATDVIGKRGGHTSSQCKNGIRALCSKTA